MAEKRMFSKSIIDSDLFLDMPATSQMLYFHLAMRADDDGFIDNAKRIQRTVGASDDDMKVLILKSFIIPFESGVIVIKHWRIHNYIKNDRYKPTIHTDEKASLELDGNNIYQLTGTTLEPERNRIGTKMEHRLDKSRLDKNREDKNNIPTVEVVDDVDLWFGEFWKLYPRKVAKANAEKAFKKKCKDEQTYTAIMRGLQNYVTACKGKDPQYIAHPATWINGERWNDEVSTKTKSSNPFLDMLNDME